MFWKNIDGDELIFVRRYRIKYWGDMRHNLLFRLAFTIQIFAFSKQWNIKSRKTSHCFRRRLLKLYLSYTFHSYMRSRSGTLSSPIEPSMMSSTSLVDSRSKTCLFLAHCRFWVWFGGGSYIRSSAHLLLALHLRCFLHAAFLVLRRRYLANTIVLLGI